MADNYKYRKFHEDPFIRDIQKETEDNFVSFDKDGNITFDGNMVCNDITVFFVVVLYHPHIF